MRFKKSFISIMLILSILLLGGCNGEDITGDATGNLSLSEDLGDCPVCDEKECPKCEKCDDCEDTDELEEDIEDLEKELDDCEDDFSTYKNKYKYTKCNTCCTNNCPTCEKCTDFSKTPVELELYELKLYKQAKPDVEKHTLDFTYTNASYQKLDKAILSFEPRCENAKNALYVSVNAKTIMSSVPSCKNVKTISIAKADLLIGDNNISFWSDTNEEYRVDDIEFESQFNDSNSTQAFDYVKLEVRELEDTKHSDLEDLNIVNYKEYEVELTSSDINNDMALEFDSDLRNGKLYVFVNGNQIYEGTIESDNNEITIPKKKLQKGTNTIKFLAVPK